MIRAAKHPGCRAQSMIELPLAAKSRRDDSGRHYGFPISTVPGAAER